MICRVLRSSCRETQNRPRRTPSHCSRPFQIFKSVRVAAQAAGTPYPNWEDFIAAHTSDNTPSAMRDKILGGSQSPQSKSKETMHLCSSQQDRLHVSQGAPVAAEETDFGQSRFGHRGFGQNQFWPKPILANPIWANPIWANPILDLVCHGGAPKGGERKVGPRKGGWPNISRFFPSPATIFALFVSLWGSSRGFLVVFEAPGPSNVHVWSSRAVV